MTSQVGGRVHRRRYGRPVTSSTTDGPGGVGTLLRTWRRHRRLTQLELAGRAGVSPRHLSFLETGRARPSREMVRRLAGELGVPARACNELLLAAGFAPVHAQHGLADEPMRAVREAVDLVLRGFEPYPAVVVDRSWTLVAGNAGVGVLTAGADPALLAPPVNVLRLALHPRGMAPRIVNLAQWRAHVLHRLARDADATADPVLHDLHRELAGYPGGESADGPGTLVAVPLRVRHGAGELSFVNTVTVFGTAVDVTAAELSIEAFLPADEATAAVLRAAVG